MVVIQENLCLFILATLKFTIRPKCTCKYHYHYLVPELFHHKPNSSFHSFPLDLYGNHTLLVSMDLPILDNHANAIIGVTFRA